MAPSIEEAIAPATDKIQEKLSALSVGKAEEQISATTGYPRKPLELSGALKDIKHFDVTPVIGREFADVDLAQWLQAPNSDELLRDLAITSMSDFFEMNYPYKLAFLTPFSLPTRCSLLPRSRQPHQ